MKKSGDYQLKSKIKIYARRIVFALIVTILTSLYACKDDDVGDNFFTFTDEMMGEYLQARPETYSEFTKMLDTTEVLGLLNAYGKYTCFAPNNAAVRKYYQERGKQSMADFPLDTLRKIVYNHLIKGFIVSTEGFKEGRLNQKSMNDRYISISYASFNSGDLTVKVNSTSPIIHTDLEVHNGVIHEIGEVLSPSELTLVEALAADPEFKIFFSALAATGLDEELKAIEDKSFDPNDYPIEETDPHIKTPKSRKYGFTALVESDSTYAKYGIYDLDDLKDYAKQVYDVSYPEDAGITDITNRKNSLNRFIAYHLVNKQISYTRFIIDYDNTGHSIKTYDMYEYIEMMCPQSLLEVRTNRATSETNLINMTDSPDKAIRIVEDNYDNDAINGVYHEIDKILVYDNTIISDIASKRLRMDAATFFPEFTNNNIRGEVNSTQYTSELWKFPPGYIDRVTMGKGTEFGYFNADDRFMDFQGDEVYLSGLYEFEITTPVIPAGTYEVRFGWKVETKRGVAQLYWDGIPCGIPLDLRIFATDPRIGYQTPGENSSDPEGFENDKMMRNRGYMKGPCSFQAANNTWFTGNARVNDGYLRRILGIYTFDEPGTHLFSVKAALSGEFMFDFLEFVPVEVLEYEGID